MTGRKLIDDLGCDCVYSLTSMHENGWSAARSTILVADDSLEIRQYLRLLLELEGYQVESAANGTEAIQRIQSGSPAALVLLDMQMPGIDGIQTLRRLRELQPELKVIMCSGVADVDTIREAVLAGAQGYLVKPIRRLYLSAAIQKCLVEKQPSVAPARLIMFSQSVCGPN